MPSRRTFTKLFGATGAMVALRPLAIAEVTVNDISISYMDGYHGGVIGHMPPGSWRDVLSALREFPDWKISLDIEPDSWAVLRREDPESFAELGRLLAEGSRVEMVGGTFAQPYGWAVSGESNIRQLQRGLRVIREAFPGLRVDTYAVQEPCWASCLPQILRSLGFSGASLKNASTAWGGYTAGFDADVVQWIGPDGTAISAVPRYALERLRFVYETESIDATEEFAQRCRQHGIEHPAGMCFQDLGWAAKPRVRRPQLQYRTWREYLSFVPKPTKSWHFTLEDILVTLPWGDSTLRQVAQQVRSAENRIVVAEKMATLAAVLQKQPYPLDTLDQAWKQLLLSQAHDAWITATTRSGRQAWAFAVAENTLDAETSAQEIIGQSTDAFALRAQPSSHSAAASQSVLLFNTLASARSELAEISIASDPRTTGFILRDASGNVLPSQAVVDRRYHTLPVLTAMSEQHEIAPGENKTPAGGINHTVLLASVPVPALGMTSLTVESVSAPPPTSATAGVSVTEQGDGRFLIQSDRYRIQIDAKQGGTISSLVSISDGTELVHAGDRRFGEYRGYFIEDKAWRSSTEQAARVTIHENGPLRATVQIDAQIGSATVSTLLTVIQGESRLDFEVTMKFPRPTFIGDPHEVAPDERRTSGRRSQNDGRWKLQVHLPFAADGQIYKSAAFDVCKSKVADTSFQDWNDIKHTIVAQWLDLMKPATNHGLAVMCDGTTAYNYGPDQSLGLVLAWAWDGGFWWGKHPIEGQHTTRFALLPHRGTWEEAALWHEYSRFCEPLVTALASAPVRSPASTLSLVDTGSPALQLSAMQMVNGAMQLRFFHASSAAAKHHIQLGFRPRRLELINLNGDRLHTLESSASGPVGTRFILELPPFGLATVRCDLA